MDAAAGQIAERALAIVDYEYGRDHQTCWPSSRPRAYHNGFHTRNVLADSIKLAEACDLTRIEKTVSGLAAVSHDLVQGLGSGQDERVSADWLVKEMTEKSPFMPTHQRMAELAILGTLPVMNGPLMIGQTVEQQTYPTKRHELVARIVASADLGQLYTASGPFIAHLLHREFVGSQASDEQVFSKLLGFQSNQPAFLEAYHYPLTEANELFGNHKKAVIAYASTLLTELEAGNLTNWQQVVEKDWQFAQQLSDA